MISYKKLFLLMEEREISKEKLKNAIGISSATMAKLAKNEEVAMSTIYALCNYFDCQPGAILSYEKEKINSAAQYSRRYLTVYKKNVRIKEKTERKNGQAEDWNNQHLIRCLPF